MSTPAPPGRRRSRVRTILRWTLLGLGLVVLALALGLFPQEPLRRFMERQIRSAVGPHSRIGRLHIVPARLQVEVYDLVVEGPAYRLEVPRARVAAAPALLLGRGVFLRVLEAERPRLLLRPPDEAPPSQAAAETPPVVIGDIRVKDGQLTYRSASLEGEVVLEGVSARGALGQQSLEFSASGGRWARAAGALPLGPAAGRVRLSPTLALTIESLDAGTPRSRVHVAGDVGSIDAPELALSVSGVLDLADLQLVQPAAPSRGRIHAEGRVEGAIETLALRMRLTGSALDAAGWPVARLDAQLEHASSAAPQTTARVVAELLDGRAEADVGVEAGRLHARVDARGLQAARAPSALWGGGPPPLQGTLGLRLRAGGELDGRVGVEASLSASGRDRSGLSHALAASASGGIWPRRQAVDLAWRGQLDSGGGRAAAAPLRSARLTLHGRARGALPPDIEAGASGGVLVPGARGPLAIPVSGRLVQRSGRLRVELDARPGEGHLALTAALRGSVVEQLSLRGRRLEPGLLAPDAGGRLELALEASGPVERLSGSGHLEGDGLAWRGVEIGAVKASVDAAGGSGRLRLEAPALQVSADGRFRPPGPRVEGELRFAGTPLARLAPLLPAGQRPLEGTFSAVLEFAGSAAEPRGLELRARVESAALSLRERKLRVPAPFVVELRGERLHIDDARIEGEGLRLAVSGEAGLTPQAPFDLQIDAAGDLSQAPAPAGWQLAGQGRAQVRASGTAAQPRATGTVELAGLQASAGGPQPLLVLPSLRVELAGDRLVLPPTEAELAGGRAGLEVRMPLAALLPAGARAAAGEAAARGELRAFWREVQAAPLLAAFGSAGREPLQASLSGRLSFAGSPAQPAAADAVLETEAAVLASQGMRFELAPIHAVLRDGRLSARDLSLSSEAGTLRAQLQVDLARRTLDARGGGRLELRALSPFLEAAAATGTAEIDVAVGGTLDAPQPRGTLSIRDGTLRVRDIPEPLTRLHARLVLDGRSFRVEDASAALGGGTLTLGGGARLAGTAVEDVRLTIAASEVAMRYPADFKSRIRGSLALTGSSRGLLLAGEVTLLRGLYDTDIFLDEALLAPEVPPATEPPSPLLSLVALDISAHTETPVRVNNNLAQLEAGGHLRVRGDLNFPAPFGRLEIQEGGMIYLQTRKFRVSSGTLIYNGTLNPELSIRAETRISQLGADDVHVTVAVSGPMMRPSLSLSSDPSYSEREIASLIATGRRGLAASGAWVAGEQTAVLLAGRLTRSLSRALMDLGLDEVDIQPELLAREEDPGARFTFGKQLTPRLKLIYSAGLNDAEARFVQAQYQVKVGRVVTLKVQRDDSGIYSYGAGQRLRWGAPPAARREDLQDDTSRLQAVLLEGDQPLAEAALRAALKVKAGDRVTFWDLQARADALQKQLVRGGWIEALVSATLDGGVAVFQIRAGARYRCSVDGLPDPPDLTDALQQALFEAEAVERGRRRLLEAAHQRGFLTAEVRTEVREAAPGERVIAFHVEPGEPVARVTVSFPGARALSQHKLLEAAGGPGRLLSAPAEARQAILDAYRREHHLAAEVGAPRVQRDEQGQALRIDVPVAEGPRARIAAVRFEGSDDPEDALLRLAALEVGAAYEPDAVSEAVLRLRDYYLKQGHASVRVTPRLAPRGPDLEVVFDVAEGERVTVGQVAIHGLRRTRPSVVSGVVGEVLGLGEPLDPRKLGVLERRLLDLDVFSRVVTTNTGNPARIDVELEEQGPYTLTYDARFSREERATGLVDAEVGNLAGLGLAVGVRHRRGPDLRELRGSVHLPLPRAGDLTGSVFRDESDFLLVREVAGSPLDAPQPYRDTEIQQGFQIQQSRHLANHWDMLYGYRFKRVSSRVQRESQDFAGVEASLLRETRDNPLNARRGRFWSLSLELAPKFLLSDVAFLRSFAQLLVARPLGDSWTWAQGYRLGVAQGLDERLLRQVQLFGRSTELFRAGGASSLRGFGVDSVGPRGLIPGVSSGGQALVILNQELRYHHPSGAGAAVFYDGGNVFARIRDVRLSLRHSLGAGLRYDSPVGLVRVDIAFPLNPQPRGRRYQWYFSLGQAF